MAKRFTDTDKWKRLSFRKWPLKIKLLWQYILDDCDIAGLWIQDMEIASIKIGAEITLDEALGFLEDKVIVLDRGNKWFIPAFMEFQYGLQLSKSNNVYKSIEKILLKYDLFQYLTIEISEAGTTKSAYRGRISKKLRHKIFIENELVCQYCQETKLLSELVVDHFIPLDKGGDNADDNLICSCVRCNSHKTDIMPDVFLAKKDIEFLNPTPLIFFLIGAFKKLKGGKDKDKVKDKVKDKDKEPNKKRPLTVEYPPELDTLEFKKTWGEWEQHRIEKKSKLTPSTKKSQLKKLAKLGGETATAMLEQSIQNGWTGIFTVKEDTGCGSAGFVGEDQRKKQVRERSERILKNASSTG